MKKLIIQFLKFLLISGTGWLIDTTIYTVLTLIFKYNVVFSNILSSVPAITFVFFVSTKKVFLTHMGKFSLKQKYFIYILYQMILIITVSVIGQILYNMTENLLNNKDLLKIIIKLVITPITMITNFFVMKFLAEKL